MSDSAHRPTSILVVEAEPIRLDALREYVQCTDWDTQVHGERELAGALERLSNGGVDAVILDPDLPDSQGIVSFERMYAFAPNVPVVVLTNEGEDDLAVRAVQGGAQDCLRKDEADPSVLGTPFFVIGMDVRRNGAKFEPTLHLPSISSIRSAGIGAVRDTGSALINPAMSSLLMDKAVGMSTPGIASESR